MGLPLLINIAGTRAAQPAAGPENEGCFYRVTDEADILEHSDGSAWVPIASGGAVALDDLTDVVEAGPADGEVLTYDSGAGVWTNLPPAGGGTVLVRTADGRLTTETGVPISSSDRTAQSTIYYTPFDGNQIALYNGAAWALSTFTERSLALSGLTTDKNYDVFLY